MTDIRTNLECLNYAFLLSHPARVRGLKFFVHIDGNTLTVVAPRAGARIEIIETLIGIENSLRRTPCGCVD